MPAASKKCPAVHLEHLSVGHLAQRVSVQALQVPEAESSKNFSGQIVRQAGAAELVESRKKLGLHLEQTVLLVAEL